MSGFVKIDFGKCISFFLPQGEAVLLSLLKCLSSNDYFVVSMNLNIYFPLFLDYLASPKVYVMIVCKWLGVVVHLSACNPSTQVQNQPKICRESQKKKGKNDYLILGIMV